MSTAPTITLNLTPKEWERLNALEEYFGLDATNILRVLITSASRGLVK